MNSDDLLYGSRSGIQKAIRRGDLNLARTCFEILWADKAQRNWLKWRLPVLVAEEAWFFAGELGDFLASEPGDDERAWRKFIYRLTLVTKSKDAHGLYACATLDFPTELEDNLSRVLAWELAQMHKAHLKAGDDPLTVMRETFSNLDSKVSFSPYAKRGIQRLVGRAFSGGMIGDKWMILACIFLFASRRVTKSKVLIQEQVGLARWRKSNGSGKPKRVNLPWYAFDMHTQLGKIALSIFMKRKAKDFGIATRDDCEEIWFFLESGYVPPELQKEATGDAEKIKCHETFWWPIAVECTLDKIDGFGGYLVLSKDWKKIRKELIGIIGWLQEKRDQERAK
jgi:hypothetical protein